MLAGIYASDATASTHPDPNTLTTKNPYAGTTYTKFETPGATWITQGVKALFARRAEDGRGRKPIAIHFVPSGGSGVTYTVILWIYNKLTNTWAQLNTGSSTSYTGEKIDFIEDPLDCPLFLQISTISTGNLDIYFDNAVASAG